MNHTASAAERHITDMENRIAQQSALGEELANAGRDTAQAERALHTLQQALELTRKHTRSLIAPAMRHARPATLPAEPTG